MLECLRIDCLQFITCECELFGTDIHSIWIVGRWRKDVDAAIVIASSFDTGAGMT